MFMGRASASPCVRAAEAVLVSERLLSVSWVAALCVGLGFACMPLAQTGLRVELEVQICHLFGQLFGQMAIYILCATT